MLFLFGSCFAIQKIPAASQSDKNIPLSSTAQFEYLASDQFQAAVSKAGLTQWTMEDPGAELEGSNDLVYSRAWRYELYNLERRIRCQFFIYLSHAGTTGLTISFPPVDAVPLMEEEQEYLLNRELPELWVLASKLCSDPQAVLDLQKKIEASYEQVKEPEQYADRISYFSEWGSQCSGIYATARVIKQDAERSPEWY